MTTKGETRQPAGGKWLGTGAMETRSFAQKRVKVRARNKAARQSRRANRK